MKMLRLIFYLRSLDFFVSKKGGNFLLMRTGKIKFPSRNVKFIKKIHNFIYQYSKYFFYFLRIILGVKKIPKLMYVSNFQRGYDDKYTKSGYFFFINEGVPQNSSIFGKIGNPYHIHTHFPSLFY